VLAGAKGFSFAREAVRPGSGTTQGSTPGLSVGKSGFMTPGPKGGMTERADYTKIKIPYTERKGVTFPDGARVAVTFEFAAEYFEGGRLGGTTENGAPFQTARGPNWN
jgi:hypothetical protein